MGVPGNANALLLRSAAAAGGYTISRSLRFNSSDSAFLSRTPSSAGNRRTWTFSCWPKRCAISPQTGLFAAGTNSSNISVVYLDTAGKLWYYDFVSGAFSTRVEASAVFRDFSAWYHIVVAVDTTQATAANRVRLYVNNTELTAFTTATYPAQNFDTQINTTTVHTINKESDFYANYGNHYIADAQLIDGQQLTPSSFGEFDANNVWQPKAYTGTYGTNGFKLDFADNSAATATTLGKDTSGNGNNWTPNNLSVTAGAGNDSLVDSPTSPAGQTDSGAGGTVVGNYATLNPLDMGSGLTLSNGNLDAASGGNTVRGTIGVSAGKWYWELTGLDLNTTAPGGKEAIIGVAAINAARPTYMGSNATSYGYLNRNGRTVSNVVETNYGATYVTGDVVGVAFDADNGTLTFYKNGVSQGQAFSGITSGLYAPALSTTGSVALNFGQRPFAYAAPSGFKALCTANLPTPTIADGSTVMDVALDTGANILTAAQNKLITGTDLIWIKDRANTNNHQLIDTVRGGTATLQSNTTAAETTYSAPSGSSVAWCWDAGTSTVTNTQGSITSSVRANASAGFSVVTFNSGGSNGEFTVGHGLGVAPKFIIMKSRTRNGGPWWVHHLSATDTTTKYLQLSTTSAVIDNGGSGSIWGAALPTSTLFGFAVGAGRAHTQNEDIVSYCFAPVAGYSSMGSYVGNGSSTSGPFVFLGFRPKFLLVKSSTGAENWDIYDSSRSSYNLNNLSLQPNLSGAEYNAGSLGFDFLSNGFRSIGGSNTNGATYIYFAVAESPFAYARAR